jgi:CTP:molybdopterin cytidylyltransferase MocA
MIAAIVLTAGKSERMGGSPKALLRLQGKTFLEHVLDAVGKAGITQTVVVVGHHRSEIEKALPSLSLIFNPDYEHGMSTSVQAGIQALPPTVEGAGIFLVDHPLIDPETIRNLASHVRPGRIVLPIFNNRPGHPIFIASDLFQEILALRHEQGLDVVVKRDPTRIIAVTVHNAGIHTDIDTPEQFSKLVQEHE